jgi:DNA topoisomerase-3
MEKHGIGTDASIPTHIQNIVQRNYVTVEQRGNKRFLKPTQLGIVLVHGYLKIDPELVLPKVRAHIEREIDLIAKGQADMKTVLHHALENFSAKFKYFSQTIDQMDSLFEASFSALKDTGKPLSRCGKCRRYMKVILQKPVRLYCMTCDETYALPQNGNIRSYQEFRCPLDDFELVMFTTGGSNAISYPLCPYCYNNPPFEGFGAHMTCGQCTHTTCKHSVVQNGVCDCFECEEGTMCFDQFSAPVWKMRCNRCNYILKLPENAQKISVADSYCDTCGARNFNLVFSKDKVPVKGGAAEMTDVCISCHEVLSELVQEMHGKSRHKMFTRGRRRGGRGRGRGRGRGDR